MMLVLILITTNLFAQNISGNQDQCLDQLLAKKDKEMNADWSKVDRSHLSDIDKVTMDNWKQDAETYNKLSRDEKISKYYGAISSQSKEMDRKIKSNEIPPVRNQDSIGWCYGFTAADLLDNYKKVKEKDVSPYSRDDLISPNSIAHKYNQNKVSNKIKELNENSHNYEGGITPDALKVVLKEGYCSEKDLPTSDTLNTDYNESLESMNVGNGTLKRSDEMKKLYGDIARYDNASAQSSCKTADDLQQMFPSQTLADINEALTKMNGKEAISYFNNLGCKQNVKKYPYSPKIVSDEIPTTILPNGISRIDGAERAKQAKMLTKVDDALLTGKLVEISYSADSIFSKADPNNYTRSHSSILVGKKLGKNCEPVYIVKNSWGTQCSNIPVSAKVECVDGYFMIPESEMKNSISGYTWLE